MSVSKSSQRTFLLVSFIYGVIKQFVPDKIEEQENHFKELILKFVGALQNVYGGGLTIIQYQRFLNFVNDLNTQVYDTRNCAPELLSKTIEKRIKFIISFTLETALEHLKFTKQEMRVELWMGLKMFLTNPEINTMYLEYTKLKAKEVDEYLYDYIKKRTQITLDDNTKLDLKVSGVSRGF